MSNTIQLDFTISHYAINRGRMLNSAESHQAIRKGVCSCISATTFRPITAISPTAFKN